MSTPSPIGYLVPEFPSQTHAFFWREMQAMEAAGVPVHLFSTRSPPPEACPHDFADTARARTTYLFPPNPLQTAMMLIKRPARTLQAISYILGLSETPLPQRLWLLGLVPTAAGLAQTARTRGMSHIHIHSCANAAHLGALAHILDGLDYSLTLHGDLPVYGTDHSAKMKRACFVSAVTAPLQRALQQEIGHDQPYPVIWMGVDVERFCPNPARNIDLEAPFKVVTIARLNYMKGHRFFLRAMAQLRSEGLHIHYQIAGDGPERAKIEAEIATLGLEDQVDMLGSISETRVLELLRSANALALTSINQGEAAPVAVMEAMSCGLPCIVSIIGGTQDMINDGVDGLLAPQRDVETITTALRKLVLDPEARVAMGQAARTSAEAKFDHRRNAVALYEAISGSKAP